MLVRILADNPGKTFTRNIDSKFVITVKELLRDGRDMSVQQILRETLDTFEMQKPNDETLRPLNAMWQKEKSKMGVSSNAVGRFTQYCTTQMTNLYASHLCPREPSTHHPSTPTNNKITLPETIDLEASHHPTS